MRISLAVIFSGLLAGCASLPDGSEAASAVTEAGRVDQAGLRRALTGLGGGPCDCGFSRR